MSKPKQPIIGAILLIILGSGWLLNNLKLIPGVDLIWILALGGFGIIILTFGGINKLTVVAGPYLMIASVLAMLRQTGRLPFDQEVPILMIVLGLLVLISYVSPISEPSWILPEIPEQKKP